MKKIIALAMSAMMLAACHDDNIILPAGEQGQIVFKSSVGGQAMSKAALNDKGTNFLFSPNEKISVFNSASSEVAKFTAMTKELSASTTFAGNMSAESISADEFFAVLPASVYASMVGGNIVLAVPDVQKPVKSNIGSENAIMVAATSKQQCSLVFNSVCSYISVKVRSGNYQKVSIEAFGSEADADGRVPLAGTVTVDPKTAKVLSISEPKYSVSIEGEIEGGNSYVFAVLPQALDGGFVIKTWDSEGETDEIFCEYPASLKPHAINHVVIGPEPAVDPDPADPVDPDPAEPEGFKKYWPNFVKNLPGRTSVHFINNYELAGQIIDYVDQYDLNFIPDRVADGSDIFMYYAENPIPTDDDDYNPLFVVYNPLDNVVVAPEDLTGMFEGFDGKYLDLRFLLTENVTNMSGMFKGCKNLEKIRFGENFYTSQVKDMSEMFSGCEKLEQLSLSGFSFSNLENAEDMFANCSSLRILDFDRNVYLTRESSVPADQSMFSGCTSLMGFDETNVTAQKAHTYEGGYFSASLP